MLQFLSCWLLQVSKSEMWMPFGEDKLSIMAVDISTVADCFKSRWCSTPQTLDWRDSEEGRVGWWETPRGQKTGGFLRLCQTKDRLALCLHATLDRRLHFRLPIKMHPRSFTYSIHRRGPVKTCGAPPPSVQQRLMRPTSNAIASMTGKLIIWTVCRSWDIYVKNIIWIYIYIYYSLIIRINKKMLFSPYFLY